MGIRRGFGARALRWGGQISLVLLLAGSTIPAIQQPSPTFRSSTELVRLDVIVTRPDGLAIRGLQKQDFAILADGTPQAIQFFEEVIHPPTREARWPRTLPADVADNTDPPGGLLVIVLDDFHFQDVTGQVQTLATEIVRAVGPHAAIALLTTSGRTRVEFTSDPAIVLEAIRSFTDRVDPAGREISPGLRAALREEVHGGRPSLVGRERGPKDPGSLFADSSSYQLLRSAATMLREERRRRKALVWISGRIAGGGGALRQAAGRATASEYLDTAFEGALGRLRAADVSVYVLSPTDTTSPALREMAASTGGFVLRPGALDQGLARVVDDLSHRYVLGFIRVENKNADKVEVSVNREGASIRTSRASIGSGTRDGRDSSPLVSLSRGAVPDGAVPLRLFAAPIASRRSRADVAVVMEIPCADSVLTAGSPIDAAFQYAVFAVDLTRRKVTHAVSRTAYFKGRTEQAGQPRCQVMTPMTLEAGSYQLRASAFSRSLSKGGSAYLNLDVPTRPAGGVELGGLVLGASKRPEHDIASNLSERRLLPFVPTLDRWFSREDVLRVFVPVWFDTRTPPIAGRVEISDPSGLVVKTADSAVVAPALDVSIPLAGLADGRHRLRARVVGASGDVFREIEFFIQ